MTPWFSISTPPTRKGKYQYQFAEARGIEAFAWWNGRAWECLSPKGAVFQAWPGDKWRGLMK
jgi:hypothetical protein